MRNNRERWLELCALAAEEQNPTELMKLIAEMSALLEAKQRRLAGNAPSIPLRLVNLLAKLLDRWHRTLDGAPACRLRNDSLLQWAVLWLAYDSAPFMKTPSIIFSIGSATCAKRWWRSSGLLNG